MALVETDFLIALINEKDRLHEVYLEIAEEGGLTLSPYTLIEVEMLWLSKRLIIENYEAFQRHLNNLLEYYSIRLMTDKPPYHATAHRLRRENDLTYFDSLHAAAALTEDLTLISSDPIYRKVENLKHLHPTEWRDRRHNL